MHSAVQTFGRGCAKEAAGEDCYQPTAIEATFQCQS